ncbi:MAG: hypothetical protein E7522_04050 [Ruminococcaceae bacterium]|nr:hypothetical protein [Oscillospiraceae bacterium]
MSKKVIGGLLALALVLSVFSFSVFAAGTGYETDTSYTQTWGLANKAGSDGTYTVDVLLTTNYPVGPIQFKIDGVDEVTSVTVGSGYYKATPSYGKTGLVMLTPDTSSNLLGKKLSNAVVATVTYKSSSNGTPAIKDDVKSASNPQGTLMAARLDGSDYVNSASFIVGQKATIVALGGEMPSPTEADLQVKSGVTGVVIDKNKTFGGKYAGAVYGFAQAANNTFATVNYLNNSLEATDGSAISATKGTKGWGTGTTVTVGTKTYVVVIFGDVDGNGLINTADANATKASVNNTKIPNDSVERLAANAQNVNSDAMMHNIVTGDASAIKNHIGGKKIDFAALAAKHASFNKNYQ